MRSLFLKSSAAWKLSVLGLLSLLAGHAAPAQDTSKTSWESEFRFALVGGSEFKDRSRIGSVDAMDLGTRDVLSVQAREGFLIRFGFELERSNFGLPKGARLPGKLQTASLVFGADLQLGEAWIVRLEIQPGFYGNRTDFRTREFNLPVIVGAS